MPEYGNLAPAPEKWTFWIFLVFFSERSSDFASNEPKISLIEQFFVKIWIFYLIFPNLGTLCPDENIKLSNSY